ncbi:MAG: hypothetical protein HY459_02840 [Parcubacteria group bacterium]|nr:hypothetical protein [Parcubacteria group bacterium]
MEITTVEPSKPLIERRTWGASRCPNCGTVHPETDLCSVVDTTIHFTQNKVSQAELSSAPNFSTELDILLDEVQHLLVSKQHDYGHDNITRHGLEGICVRLGDKQARIHHLLHNLHVEESIRRDGPMNESVRDTFLDVVGYGLLGLMVLDNTFTLPLPDEPR